ncbi:uncharacterized protein Z518_00538 [Rhinocladiella mackenziei CBS 650.93]|uniref:Uncharacterized protein n=1 Tax=Rhinocladiella mackenziei CBS 650.93 TaxID=1442369 RepID=A0A0D2HFK1_9EURO|nr:uncharacterized protein Z518_00538 [Rhinocladiella mackenziei CBS 650.93]KIX09458.1 hypothetical protein Z518_00538 [Rhinocladiella mackenziei CBS 650.93]
MVKETTVIRPTRAQAPFMTLEEERGFISTFNEENEADTSAEEPFVQHFSTVLCNFFVALDLTIIGTAVSPITNCFHSLGDVVWYRSAFYPVIAAIRPVWGEAFKFFDLKYAYLRAVFIFELASLVCAVTPSSPVLIVGCAVARVGGAGLASVYINLPIGVGVATFAILLGFHTPRAARPQAPPLKEKVLHVDIPGVLTVVGTVTCYLLALQWDGMTTP